jgi:uncharacterized FAD-dependent dehydrogenase
VHIQLCAVLSQPHLGTDRLIGILRAFRAQLLALGVRIQWGTAVRSLNITASGNIAGVHLEGTILNNCSQCSCVALEPL